jgi:hypothetical protein
MATKKAVTKAKKAQYVVVRTQSAGVHCGELVMREGKEVTLRNARRIWRWQGANTLHEISLRGVASGSKVSETVESITLTEAIEVIHAAEAGRKNLESATWAA